MDNATYSKPLMREYEGNPLVEALPSMDRSDRELLDVMKVEPIFSETDRSAPASVRREMANRLSTLFIPLPIHFELFEELSGYVRRSYVWRNPLAAGTQAFLHHPGVHAVTGSAVAERTASSCLLMIKGVSGIGKSSAIQSCLRALGPQSIKHTSYNGQTISETQVVWVTVTCPEDRSLKSLCVRILESVDAALGVRHYTTQYLTDPRLTVGVMINAVFSCLANAHVGVLAVDEIQNLFSSKGEPALQVLNFLLRLKDESGLCLVLCGTYAALDLLNRKFRLSRRVAGNEIELQLPSSVVDETWVSFAEILWQYQWLPEPEAYSEEHSQTLFDLTLGIRGIAVSLFIAAQKDAIRSGEQAVTSARLRDTWNRRFGIVHCAMAALRSGRPGDLAKWDDLCDSLTLQALMNAKRRGAPLRCAGQTESVEVAESSPDSLMPRRAQRKGKTARVEPGTGSLGKLRELGGLAELTADGTVGLPPG